MASGLRGAWGRLSHCHQGQASAISSFWSLFRARGRAGCWCCCAGVWSTGVGGVVIEEFTRLSGPWLVRRPLPGSRASEPTSLRRPDCDDDDGRTTANWLGASASGQATSHGHMQILNFISPVVSSAMGMRVTPDAVTWAGLSFHNNCPDVPSSPMFSSVELNV